MKTQKYIVIGGSAGSFKIIIRIIKFLPANFKKTIFLTLHRLKHVRSGFVEALSLKANIPIVEPKDKEIILTGRIYLAPANYHLYIEPTKTISLSTEELVNHSRPSIDLTFQSAAHSLKDNVAGIILSGANRDGAEGLKQIKLNGGFAIVQNPEECQVLTMPTAALKKSQTKNIYSEKQIIEFILNCK